MKVAKNPSPKKDKLQPELSEKSAAIAKRKRDKSMIVRRSSRLKSSVRHVRNQDIGPVAEEIDLVDSEGEDEPCMEEHLYEPHVELPEREDEPRTHDEPVANEGSLEEKIAYLLQTIEELKSKVISRQFSDESTATALSYKSLYLASQKKIEALTDENHQLSKKLEVALAKVEGYDSAKEFMEKFKDIILMSNLAKVTETMEAVLGQFSALGGATEPENVVGPNTARSKKKRHGQT